MSKKQIKKFIVGDIIVRNLLIIIASSILLMLLSLLFLRFYTRHGQNVVVPALEGLQVSEANTLLNARGLHVEVVDSIYDRNAVPGAIIDQTPKGGNKVKEGRSIYITIYSKSPQQIAVPGLVDYSTRQATALLNSMGFNQIMIEEVPSEYTGLVMAVKYRGKTLTSDEKIPAGSPITLVVTSGLLADSLRVDNEYIVPPGQVDSGNSEEGEIDRSFF
jgi:beta-lactam-binding protein with PASTA domain